MGRVPNPLWLACVLSLLCAPRAASAELVCGGVDVVRLPPPSRGPSLGSIATDPVRTPTNCTWVLGGDGALTTLRDIVLDSEPGEIIRLVKSGGKATRHTPRLLILPFSHSDNVSLSHRVVLRLDIWRVSLPSVSTVHGTPPCVRPPHRLILLGLPGADASWADPSAVVLRVRGYTISRGRDSPAPPVLVSPLLSRSGWLTVQLWQDAGQGNVISFSLRADYNVTTGPSSPPPREPPAPALPLPAEGPSRRISSTADLRAALADPSVSLIILSAHLLLDGREISLARPNPSPGAATTLPNRSVTIRGDAASCPPTPPFPPGACVIDAGGLSRHFHVRGRGAALALDNVALVGGSALIGGSVLVETGGVFSATRTAFAASRAVGDGGAVLALGQGSSLALQNCALPGKGVPRVLSSCSLCRPAQCLTAAAAAHSPAGSFDGTAASWGVGGAVAAVMGAAVNASYCTFTGTFAQSGARTHVHPHHPSQHRGAVCHSVNSLPSCVRARRRGGCGRAGRRRCHLCLVVRQLQARPGTLPRPFLSPSPPQTTPSQPFPAQPLFLFPGGAPCSADGQGGSMFISLDSALAVERSEFVNGTAKYFGGACPRLLVGPPIALLIVSFLYSPCERVLP